MVRAQEKEAKVKGFFESQGTSVTARSHEGDFHALTASKEVLTIEGNIKALIEERDFLRLLIERQ